ncbi:PilN domain-containing protein [Dyella caseinilytica]|uniref:PilN domain-containing protein n=1 Tax=Dyella caseinilytica TaxID=1849581 RepID=A0ABX7GR77_9GAMM|nr:PilN domain-containing protein [Dyella caseinilytica]QRN52866.1 PilN domain-containing protein [Dyella caseinilytica]GGA09368.1 fimbrial protein [Dyella caseinilytica]
MARINLLPWRAERRKQRQREFFMQLGAAAVAGIGVLMLWGFWMGMRIDNQNERNAYLQDQIKQVDVRLDKIKDLEKVRSQLLARKQIIEQLQANRSQMVHLFDELVKTVPGSVRLTSIKQAGDQMVLDGVAQSNASVAEYMRNIEISPWMGQTDLSKTENSHDASRMPYSFGLTVSLQKPKDDGTDQGNAAPASSSSSAGVAAPIVPAATALKPVMTPSATAKAPAQSGAAPVKGGAK